MRVLVAIANFGTKNRRFLDRVIREYRSMSFPVDIVVLSDRPKDVGEDVEIRVGLPSGDPWSLPFAHKSLFSEKKDDYDYFIYSEDDTLLTEASIRAFMNITRVLPPDRIAGFLRYEQDAHGNRFCTSVHSHFHWVPGSIERYGDYMTAYFTNEHAACFILTRDQLHRAIGSGGFLVTPHQGAYDLACTAATDPYTSCGMRKVVPISHLDDFMLHHLPDRYHQRIGIGLDELRRQLSVLQHRGGRETRDLPLFSIVKGLPRASFNKSYYEIPDPELLNILPSGISSVLSVGCGWGELESRLVSEGIAVTGIPLDEVIAESARMRGVTTLSSDFETAEKELGDRRFDCVVLSNILHHLEEPSDLLRRLKGHVFPEAAIVGKVPNHARYGVRKKMGISPRTLRSSYLPTKMHYTSPSIVKQWLKKAGWRPEHFCFAKREEPRFTRRVVGKAFPQLVSDSILFRGLR